MSFESFYRATAGIGDAYSKGLDEFTQRSALAKLGTQLQGGDYGGAAQTAFAAGDVGTGVSLLKLGEERRQSKLQEDAGKWFQEGLSGGMSGLGSPGSTAGSGLAPLGAPSRALPSFAQAGDGGGMGDYLASTRAKESGGNDLARNPSSTATGRYQFTEGTWNGLARKYPNLGLTPNGRTDPAQQERAMQAFTRDNAQALTAAGIPINPQTLYGAHFLGAPGATRFIRGAANNPDAPASQFADERSVRANRSVFFNRDGSPKTAGEVFAWMGRGRGGGSAPTGRAPVAVAENEADVQALESRMGMTPQAPQQIASADPRADLPAEGAMPAGYFIPEGQGAVGEEQPVGARRALPPSPSLILRGASGVPMPGGNQAAAALGGGGASTDRTMTLPEEAGGPPVQVAQAGGGVPGSVASDAAAQNIGGVPVAQISGSGLGQRLPFLMRAVAHPNLPASQRQLAQTLLKEALDEAKMPDSVKEFQYARANGWTQARTPGEYAREQKGPQTVAPGSSVLAPDGQSVAFTVPDRSRTNVTDDVEARRQAAASLGLREGSPQFQSYVLTGKMPREDQQPLTASDKKAILEADDAIVSAETAIGNLRSAKALSAKAYQGPLANWRGWAAGLAGSETGQATQELDNLVTTNALGQLKAIFGAAPTEGERKILLDIQGSSNLPHALRVKIYDRGIALAERRLQINRERADDMRGQTYFRPDGGSQGSRSSSGGARALPAPSPSNRPGAASAGDRFGALVGSGMSREQAFEQMQQEGY
ncbi:lysozyme family protein [Methylorubrum thiocyanatum]|uniref:hypothetical protein n=1 Tax=Methylorubrum thiocyanatum TaxID=47958 RepID=UPI00398C759F